MAASFAVISYEWKQEEAFGAERERRLGFFSITNIRVKFITMIGSQERAVLILPACYRVFSASGF